VSPWPTFELLGITYFIGKIKLKLYFMVLWLSEVHFFSAKMRGPVSARIDPSNKLIVEALRKVPHSPVGE